MLTPRIHAVESWCGSGDIDIWFLDNTSPDLRDRVSRELNELIPTLHEHARSIYHVEELVDHILLNMRKSSNLRINQKTKQWVWAEEVDYGKGRYSNNNIQKCK